MMDETQELLRGWIDRIRAERGWSRTQLAHQAGLTTSTVTRLFRNDYKGTLNAATIAKLSRATGISAPPNLGGIEGAVTGFHEPEITPAVAGEYHSSPNLTDWIINGNSLVLAGYMPGDRITVDDSASPKPGDVVVAQLYNNERGTAETVIRIWQPPYLTTASITVEDRKPVLVDGQNALIRGVVIKMLRLRNP